MKMIFIVGASRSGTTMLNRVLGNHSQITALNELHYFGDLWQPKLKQTRLPISKVKQIATNLLTRHHHGIWGKSPNNRDEKIAEKIIENLADSQLNGTELFYVIMKWIANDNNCDIVTEQTPGNIFYAKELLDTYEQSSVIQLIRDPRAVLSSQKNRWKRKWLGGANTPWAEIIRVWINYHPITTTKLWTKSVNAGQHLSSHPRYLSVRFEDIVEDPRKEIKKICDFLNIDYQEKMENVPQVGSSMKNNQESKNGISASSLNSWKTTLTSGEIALCERLSKPYMRKYDYLPVSDKVPFLSTAFYLFTFPLHLIGVALINPRKVWLKLKAGLTN
ncbi:MAG: sulfotransferase [Methylococcales bacterium]